MSRRATRFYERSGTRGCCLAVPETLGLSWGSGLALGGRSLRWSAAEPAGVPPGAPRNVAGAKMAAGRRPARRESPRAGARQRGRGRIWAGGSGAFLLWPGEEWPSSEGVHLERPDRGTGKVGAVALGPRVPDSARGGRVCPSCLRSGKMKFPDQLVVNGTWFLVPIQAFHGIQQQHCCNRQRHLRIKHIPRFQQSPTT